MILSPLRSETAAEELREDDLPARTRRIRVLTVTPFYPSAEDATRGSFVSAALARMRRFDVLNETIAVRPFYRKRSHPAENAPATWQRYFPIPSNLGLATAGEFLASSLMRSVAERHRSLPFDLIHAHAALPCGHAAARLSKHLSIPFAVSVHGLDAFFIQQGGPVVGGWCKQVAADVYRAARVVVCISEKVREQVLSAVDANTTVVYNGVDPDLFSPAPDSSSPSTVLSVGNLIPTKGHALLIRAFAQVLAAIPDCSLEIIGDGPESRNLVELAAELKISDRVHFRGRQGAKNVADAMRRCSVFALPSWYEGLGCVFLEAMACAKPVIGCCEQGIDEIIEHGKTGMLVPAKDEAALHDSLLILLRNKEMRQRIGMSARQAVLERFTLEHQAHQLAEVYHGSVA